MAVPKFKSSKAKGKTRMSINMKLAAPQLVECSTCGSKVLAHRVCPKCGFYKGRQAIEVEKLD